MSRAAPPGALPPHLGELLGAIYAHWQDTAALPSSTDLARSTGHQRGPIVRRLQQLEGRGYISRPRQQGDRPAPWPEGALGWLGRTHGPDWLGYSAPAKAAQKRTSAAPDIAGSQFPGRVLDAPPRPGRTGLRVLKSGMTNQKLGGQIGWGRWEGARIYHLSLEERATCPRSCAVWAECYGNNMPLALRYNANGALLDAIDADLELLAHRRRPAAIRLHTLGDFPSLGYAAFWADRAERYAGRVSIFGFTAHPRDSAIGALLAAQPWRRFAIRFSGDHGEAGSVVADARPSGLRAFRCAEQRGVAESCAACAACWESRKPVIFRPH